MKLKEIRTALRQTKGDVLFIVEMSDGAIINIPIQKGKLSKHLGEVYGKSSAETCLTFKDETLFDSAFGGAASQLAESGSPDDEPPLSSAAQKVFQDMDDELDETMSDLEEDLLDF